jgi:iron(III) transport system substrate-binding protein
MRPRLLALAALPLLATCLAACSDDSDELVIYSGRSEELVGPLLEQLDKELDVDVEVRYADSAELAAQLLEEGDATEADLFFSQDAGALGAVAEAGLLSQLDQQVLASVDEQYQDVDGRWVATSARARVIVYNPELAPEVAEFDEIDDILDEKYTGEIGIAPTNASFQAFVTALRVERGEEAVKQWLGDLQALDVQIYENNIDILDAVDAGEVSLGLINHYYWFEKAAEVGEENVTARIHYLDSDDPGALINVAGVGIVTDSDQQAAAEEAVSFLLSETGQQYFADTTAEYPVVDGITTSEHDIVPLNQLTGHQIDLNDLASLEETLALLDEVGLT